MVDRRSAQSVGGAVVDQLQSRRGAPADIGSRNVEAPGGTTIWLGGSGQFVDQNSASNGTPGYSGSAGGSVAGIDGTVVPVLPIGVAGGFSSPSVDTPNAATYQGTSAQLRVYASYRRDSVFIDAQAGVVRRGHGAAVVADV
jgi:uncharacterized protein with beta-barrel porin domain